MRILLGRQPTPEWGIRHSRSWSRLPFPLILAGLHLISGLPMGNSTSRVWRALDGALGAIFGAVCAILILTVAVIILDTYLGTDSALLHAACTGLLRSISEAMKRSTTVHLLRATTVPVVLTILGTGTSHCSSRPARRPFPTRRRCQALIRRLALWLYARSPVSTINSSCRPQSSAHEMLLGSNGVEPRRRGRERDMIAESNKASVRRYFDEVWVHGDVAVLEELSVPGSLMVGAAKRTSQ
jgi:hypothetical protein